MFSPWEYREGKKNLSKLSRSKPSKRADNSIWKVATYLIHWVEDGVEEASVVLSLVRNRLFRRRETGFEFIAKDVGEVQQECQEGDERHDETWWPHEGLVASRVAHRHVPLHRQGQQHHDADTCAKKHWYCRSSRLVDGTGRRRGEVRASTGTRTVLSFLSSLTVLPGKHHTLPEICQDSLLSPFSNVPFTSHHTTWRCKLWGAHSFFKRFVTMQDSPN